MMKSKLFVVGALSLFVAFNANAKDARKNPQVEGYRVKYKEIDKSGKGYIDEKTYIKYHGKQWKLLNEEKAEFIDKNKFVTKCEKIGECPARYKEKVFTEIDLNKDGKITKKEYEHKVHMEFLQMDKSGNGKLTEEDYIKGKIKLEEKYKSGDMTVKEDYKAKTK